MLLGPVLLMELAVGKVSLKNVICVGLMSLVVWIPLTLAVDSYFWRRLVWPEAEVRMLSSDWLKQSILSSDWLKQLILSSDWLKQSILTSDCLKQ